MLTFGILTVKKSWQLMEKPPERGDEAPHPHPQPQLSSHMTAHTNLPAMGSSHLESAKPMNQGCQQEVECSKEFVASDIQ